MKTASILAALGLTTAALAPLATGLQEGGLVRVLPPQADGSSELGPGEELEAGEGRSEAGGPAASERPRPDGSSPESAEEAPEFDRRDWRERLLDPDLDRREASFEELLALAGGSSEVREVLERWSRDEFETELAWSARLLLRELREHRELQLAPGIRPLPGTTLSPFGSGPGGRAGDPLEQLESRMRQLESELDRMFGQDRWPAPGGDPLELFRSLPRGNDKSDGGGLPGQLERRGHSFRMQAGPDGVRVEIEVEENGELQQRTYEAGSLEELLESHPELRERISGGGAPEGGLQPFDYGLRWDRGVPVPSLDELLPGLSPARPPSGQAVPRLGPDGGPRREVLGVMMSEPRADQSWTADLQPGLGLRVRTVVPGSLAQALGVRAGDILLELEGRALRSGEDVREALARRPIGEPVELLVLRSGQRRELVWSPRD